MSSKTPQAAELRSAAALLCISAAVIAAPSFVTAQPRMSDGCVVRDRSEAIVVMVCAPELGANRWREAAERACGDRQMCNVWIWDEAAKAPGKAPATDAEIPRQTAGAAVAVWANDSKSLLRIRPSR